MPGVEGDRVRQVLLPHQLHDEGLPGGVSSACTAPRRNARRRTCQKRTVRSSRGRRAGTRDHHRGLAPEDHLALLEAVRDRPRVEGERNEGIAPTKFTSPRSRAEPVSWYTSQFWAIVCIQVPTREVSWPKNQRRKLRWRSPGTSRRPRRSRTGALSGSIHKYGLHRERRCAASDKASRPRRTVQVR